MTAAGEVLPTGQSRQCGQSGDNGGGMQEFGSRRTFAIISHPDTGKTTPTAKLLLESGTCFALPEGQRGCPSGAVVELREAIQALSHELIAFCRAQVAGSETHRL